MLRAGSPRRPPVMGWRAGRRAASEALGPRATDEDERDDHKPAGHRRTHPGPRAHGGDPQRPLGHGLARRPRDAGEPRGGPRAARGVGRGRSPDHGCQAGSRDHLSVLRRRLHRRRDGAGPGHDQELAPGLSPRLHGRHRGALHSRGDGRLGYSPAGGVALGPGRGGGRARAPRGPARGAFFHLARGGAGGDDGSPGGPHPRGHDGGGRLWRSRRPRWASRPSGS